jgi:hypothetical protein
VVASGDVRGISECCHAETGPWWHQAAGVQRRRPPRVSWCCGGSLARGGPLRAKMCTSSLYCSARGRHPAVWRMRTAAEKDIVRKPEPVLRLRRYWQDATLSWPAPARLCCQSFSLLTPSRRAGLRSGEPMPIAGGNLGAPSSRRRFSCNVRAFLDPAGRFPERSFVSPIGSGVCQLQGQACTNCIALKHTNSDYPYSPCSA